MAEKTRGAIQILIKSIISGMKKKSPPKFVGKDYFGTKYYEELPGSTGRKTRGRFFEPVDSENFEQDMPAEWESWLRYRRNEPPTTEEIEANYRMILTKRENAAKLDIEYSAKRIETKSLTDDKKVTGTSFPVYDDYKSGFNEKKKSNK